MRCEDAVRDLPRYAEGAIGGWSRLILRLHIVRCGSCRRRLAALRECGRSLAEALQTSIDAPDMTDAVMASIGAIPTRAARSRARWVLAPVAIACGVIAVAAVLIHQPAPSKPPRLLRNMTAPLPKPAPKVRVAEHAVPVRIPTLQKHRQRPCIATVPGRDDLHREPVREVPQAARERPPEPVSMASSKIVVVVTQPDITSAVEVEATNPATGTVVRYTASYDSAGNKQSTYTAFSKGNPDKEGT